jgi:hypothetical protein
MVTRYEHIRRYVPCVKNAKGGSVMSTSSYFISETVERDPIEFDIRSYTSEVILQI